MKTKTMQQMQLLWKTVKKWPVIRHVRYFIYCLAFNRWWREFGRNYWLHPNRADLDYLEAVWRGEL